MVFLVCEFVMNYNAAYCAIMECNGDRERVNMNKETDGQQNKVNDIIIYYNIINVHAFQFCIRILKGKEVCSITISN